MLAIAALILVVVLVAVPQLQQNQRNNARQAIANRIVAEINNYAGNNNGQVPIADTSADRRHFGQPDVDPSFFARYFDCDGESAPDTVCGTDINDPLTGIPVGLDPGGTSSVRPRTEVNTGVPNANITADDEDPGINAPLEGAGDADGAGSIFYVTGAVCDGELITTEGASPRNFAFSMRLEGGAIYCLENR